MALHANKTIFIAGKIDAATITQMSIPRCGKSDTKFKDYNSGEGGRYRRYNPQGTKWTKVT